MASTTFLAYVKPSIYVPSSVNRSTSFATYISFRVVSGLYATSLRSSVSKKNWKPSALHPIGKTAKGEDVFIDPAWNRYYSDLGGRKLGGATFPTVPDITEFFQLSQNNATEISKVQQAMEQMAQANAGALAAILQVVQNAALAGAAQIPPVVLARQETTAPPTPDPLGGGGGGGD